MKFETAFSCGDVGWTFDGLHVRQRTIGQIRIEYTKSPGLPEGSFFEGSVIQNDGENIGPQAETYKEVYMCVETGIGSGSLLTLGEHIFKTKEECEVACAEAIERERVRVESVRQWERKQILDEEFSLRRKLERIEKLKAEAA